MLPSGIRIWKNPRPLIAMSSGCSVVCRVPVVKIFWVPATRTPVPTCRPEGNWVSWVLWAPGWRLIWYSRSSNSGRSRLKPVVETLARLLEMVLSMVSWADRPVLLTHSAACMSCLLAGQVRSADLQKFVGGLGVLFGGAHHLDVQLELPGQGQHGGHLFHRVDVAAFEKSGDQGDGAIGGLLQAIIHAHQAVFALVHGGLGRLDQLDAVHLGQHVRRFALGAETDGAVDADLHLVRGRQGDGPEVG